jgi:hypothetical protein
MNRIVVSPFYVFPLLPLGKIVGYLFTGGNILSGPNPNPST